MLSTDARGGGKHGLLLRLPSRPTAEYCGKVAWTTVTGAPAGSVESADSKQRRVPEESWSATNILGAPSGPMTVRALAAAEILSVRGSPPHAALITMQVRTMPRCVNRTVRPYWQVIPGAHCALNEPFAVTEPVPPVALVPVKVKVPRTAEGEELMITSWPEIELNMLIAPPLV